MSAFIVPIVLFIMLAIGMPVGLTLLLVGSIGLMQIGGLDTLVGILITTPLSTAGIYELISIPMFILMAELVLLSGVANDLFKSAAIWVGRTPGGMAIATALAGAGFGAISGSSTASAATLSATTIPAMLKQGYDPRMAGGVVAVSGTLAMLIPPSIALILYGIIADVSVSKLLIAGVIPGIVVTLTVIATVLVLVARNPSHAPAGQAYSMKEKFQSLRTIGPMLFLFITVTGAIYSGIATPTEASALGAFGALLIAIKEGAVNRRSLFQAATRALHASGMIMLIVICAKVFGYYLTLTQLTQELVVWVGALDMSPWMIITIILFGYILLGCIMDQVAILILTVPLILPLIKLLGFDPIWFGVIVVVVAEVGLITPPLGLNVFVVSRYTKRPISEVFSGVWPHVIAHLFIIALMVIFPQIILWLPSIMAD